MEKKIKPDSKMVKKETMWMVASIALVAGFLGGVVFGVYKSGTGTSVQESMLSQPAEEEQGASVESAAQIFELEKRTSESPDDVAAWIDLGNLYFDTGNYEKAITAYNKALELKPNNANVITDLGVMYRRSAPPNFLLKYSSAPNTPSRSMHRGGSIDSSPISWPKPRS